MTEFKFRMGQNDGSYAYLFEGFINETSSFPSMPDKLPENIIIDLEKVSMINSIGVRKWMEWSSQLPRTNVVLRKIPKALVDQMNMVAGFMPGHAKIESFFVPYYFDKTDEVLELLYNNGPDFTQGSQGKEGSYKIKDYKHPETGEMGELDVMEDRYFKIIL